jgi:hypothetical protein
LTIPRRSKGKWRRREGAIYRRGAGKKRAGSKWILWGK